MPRSSSSRSSSSSRPFSQTSMKPPALLRNPSSVSPYTPPTTGTTLKESLVSGVGSGIGFGIGSRIVSGIFGAPVVAVEKVEASISETKSVANSFAQTTVPNLQQCYKNAFDVSEKPLCYALLSNESRHHEFKECMETSENQIHMCKEFLPKE